MEPRVNTLAFIMIVSQVMKNRLSFTALKNAHKTGLFKTYCSRTKSKVMLIFTKQKTPSIEGVPSIEQRRTRFTGFDIYLVYEGQR